jgi:hypothetical protein
VNRIFYFTGHRLTVLHWKRKTFTGACSFEPDADGMDKFRQYLQTTANISTKFLVDVIEEDFRIEVIPHVRGKDQKAVLGRLFDRYYRSSNKFVYSEVLGRKKTGRKDNDVLVGGITNPQLIQPWIDIIEECAVPLTGIWSLPLVSKKILPILGAKTGPVLLVSQQVNSNLRQTFFRDGKMQTSRQSVINQDAKDISNIGVFAGPEVERTIDFLRNQRLLDPNELVQIHVLGSKEQMASLESSFNSGSLQEIFLHEIMELQDKIGLVDLPANFSDGLFAWLSMNQWETSSHYGKPSNYSQYYYTLGSSMLYALSVVVFVVALIVTESNISSAIEHSRSVELLSTQAVEYKKVYKRKFEAFEPVFTHARSMNAAVDLADLIRRNGSVSPLDFMIEISNALATSSAGAVQVDSLEWTTQQYNEKSGKKKIHESKTDVTVSEPVEHVAIIKGRISISDENYRGSVTQVNKIISTLMKHERIEFVEAIDMPVEVRPERNLSSESGLGDGASSKKRPSKDQGGIFSLKIIMKAPDHA